MLCLTHNPTAPLPLHSEWLTNQHRDTYATHLGHHDQLAYFAVAQNDAVGRVKYQLLEVGRSVGRRLDVFRWAFAWVCLHFILAHTHTMFGWVD